jgi:ATP-dependent DNA ligase
MKNSISKQGGLTLISWIVVIVFVLFQGVIAMNVLPVYMSDATVASVMKELPNDAVAQRASAKELKGVVIKKIRMNSVYTIKPEYIKVKKGRGENIVIIDYEPRGKLIGTLDYIVSFHHEARIQTR